MTLDQASRPAVEDFYRRFEALMMEEGQGNDAPAAAPAPSRTGIVAMGRSILSRKWALPALSLLAAGIFVAVHFAGGTTDDNIPTVGDAVYDDFLLVMDDDRVRPFSLSPTVSPDSSLVPVPTTIAIVHNVPGISDSDSDDVSVTVNINIDEQNTPGITDLDSDDVSANAKTEEQNTPEVETPKTPKQVPKQPFFHNAEFLKGCDPKLCELDEDADFHSMSNEDECIYEIFYTNPLKCCRVVMEIGAGDGDRFSASRFFEEGLNWRSLLIEANPESFQDLQQNRIAPKATTELGAFCDAEHMLFDNGRFHAVGGSVEVASELHSPPIEGSVTQQQVPCLSMENVFSRHGITHVDVMFVRVQGDALAFIRSMDWTVRVDIWVILMNGPQLAERDDLVRSVLRDNEYVQAEWDISRWCAENGKCLNNEVFLRKGFDPLPEDIYQMLSKHQGRSHH